MEKLQVDLQGCLPEHSDKENKPIKEKCDDLIDSCMQIKLSFIILFNIIIH